MYLLMKGPVTARNVIADVNPFRKAGQGVFVSVHHVFEEVFVAHGISRRHKLLFSQLRGHLAPRELDIVR